MVVEHSSTSTEPVGVRLPATTEKVNPNSLSREIENVLSKELQAVSLQSRTRVQEEIHGVGSLCPEETPLMMEQALLSMQYYLDKIPNKTIYQQLSPFSYLHTRDWMLRFLRCELYDCRKAAERLVRFTEYMAKDFHMGLLERPLCLNDLENNFGSESKKIMEYMKQGTHQLLPFRDRSGRRVISTHAKAMVWDLDIRKAVFTYLLLVASNDRETQQKGIVWIMWGVNSELHLPKKEDLVLTQRLLDAVPLRVACLHECCDDNPIFQVYRIINVLMMTGANNKLRLQTHLGNSSEVRYKLLGYGIPVELLPFTDSNRMKTKSWKIWLEGRRAVEMLEEQRRNNYDPTPIDLIECPLSTDVVFKVGTSSQTHPGNVAFQEQLLDWYERYFTSSKAEKEIIMSAIINHVQELNGRFLEWDERGCWRVIHDISVIRLKVYHSMFYMQRSANAAKSQQSSASSTYIFERQDGRKRKRDPDGMETSACGNVCRHWL